MLRYSYTHICTHMYIYIYIHMYMHISLFLSLYIYIYIHMYMHMKMLTIGNSSTYRWLDRMPPGSEHAHMHGTLPSTLKYIYTWVEVWQIKSNNPFRISAFPYLNLTTSLALECSHGQIGSPSCAWVFPWSDRSTPRALEHSHAWELKRGG